MATHARPLRIPTITVSAVRIGSLALDFLFVLAAALPFSLVLAAAPGRAPIGMVIACTGVLDTVEELRTKPGNALVLLSALRASRLERALFSRIESTVLQVWQR